MVDESQENTSILAQLNKEREEEMRNLNLNPDDQDDLNTYNQILKAKKMSTPPTVKPVEDTNGTINKFTAVPGTGQWYTDTNQTKKV